MLFLVGNITNYFNMQLRLKIYPKSIPDSLVTGFLFAIIPVIYYFELWIVLPKFHAPWGPAYVFHFCTGNFILFNLCSNLVAVVLTETSINGRILPSEGGKNWRFCPVCEAVAPPRSWHCPTCDVCVLKRDHHCMFTSCCIGHHNHRFFVVFLLYIFVATVYSSYFNLRFIWAFIKLDSWMSLLKIVFPLAMLFMEWTEIQVYLSFMVIVLLGGVFTGTLLYYHLNLILKGLLTHEWNHKLSAYDYGKMANLKIALGDRWYLTWISPFIESKLPCDGISWETRDSIKGK